MEKVIGVVEPVYSLALVLLLPWFPMAIPRRRITVCDKSGLTAFDECCDGKV
jgi:hypothetical protein